MTHDAITLLVLLEWRTVQDAERLVAGPVWVDSGLVFTREDGSPLPPEWISQRFDSLLTQHAAIRRRHAEGWSTDQIARRHRVEAAKVIDTVNGEPLPPIRFHDLRHGAATPALSAGVDMKVISETLGHARSAFTSDVYTSVIPELAKAAAEATAAMVPRRSGSTSDPHNPEIQNQRSPR